jgi:hypothetical protein
MSHAYETLQPPRKNEATEALPVRSSNVHELHNRAPCANIVCGLLVFASYHLVPPDLFGVNWNLFLTGISIVIIALASLIAHGNVARNYWSGANVVAGLWLLSSTKLMPSVPAVTWTQVCLGTLAIAIALTSLANEELVRGQFRTHNDPNITIH